MAGNGELMRSMRAGGGTGIAAVQELLRRAKAGAVSPAELKQVQATEPVKLPPAPAPVPPPPAPPTPPLHTPYPRSYVSVPSSTDSWKA